MKDVIKFFDSNFFIALITLVVGLTAFIIYIVQKKDQKKDAANIILLEIKSAERAIKRIRENLEKGTLASDVFIMPSESWIKYKYLFVNDFDRDEWDAVTDFYNGCKLLDDDVRYNNSAFWSDVEEIRANKQRALAKYTQELVSLIESTKSEDDRKKLTDEFKKRTEQFDTLYMERQVSFGYNPNKPINDAKLHVGSLSSNLSQTSVGGKLKKFANV